MNAPVKVAVGDKVIVSRQQQEPREAEVVKVGRAWVTLAVTYRSFQQLQRFRLDTQTDGSKIGIPPRFFTLDQWAAAQAASRASRFLRGQGIQVDSRSPWHGREVELADLIVDHLAKIESTTDNIQERLLCKRKSATQEAP